MKTNPLLLWGDEEAKQRAITSTVLSAFTLFTYTHAFHFPLKLYPLLWDKYSSRERGESS